LGETYLSAVICIFGFISVILVSFKKK
jgi:hypothetical protein